MARSKELIKSCGVLVAMLCFVLTASAAKKPEMTRVYIFGFAASFVDSLAYQTDVQQLDSAWIEPAHKFLVDRSLYSLQLQYYLESAEGKKNTVCTVFFDTNQRRLQKRWNKVKNRYEKAEGLHLTPLTTDRFRFKAEEWKEIIQEEPATAAPAPSKDDKTKKTKKGKS